MSHAIKAFLSGMGSILNIAGPAPERRRVEIEKRDFLVVTRQRQQSFRRAVIMAFRKNQNAGTGRKRNTP